MEQEVNAEQDSAAGAVRLPHVRRSYNNKQRGSGTGKINRDNIRYDLQCFCLCFCTSQSQTEEEWDHV